MGKKTKYFKIIINMLVITSSQISPQGYRPVRLTLPVPMVRAWDTLQFVSSFKFAISAQFSCGVLGRDWGFPPSNPFLPSYSKGEWGRIFSRCQAS